MFRILTHSPTSLYLYRVLGRAIAQAVSHRLPTATARVRDQFRSCGICSGLSGTGACFLRGLRFPLRILIQLTAPHSSSSIIWGWYNRPISGRRTKWTQSHPTSSATNYCILSRDLSSVSSYMPVYS
jgi:hypothetical protein